MKTLTADAPCCYCHNTIHKGEVAAEWNAGLMHKACFLKDSAKRHFEP